MKVNLEPPLNVQASLRTFGRWGDDGIDRWDTEMLVRTARLDDGRVVPFAAQPIGDLARPALEMALRMHEADIASQVAQLVRATFITAPPELDALAQADERVGRLVALYPGVVPVLVTDPLSALIRSISAQQVNLRWASTIRRRLAERYGTLHQVAGTFAYSLHAEPLARATVDELRALQLTTAKSRSVIAVAQAAVAGELERREVTVLEDDAVIAHLIRLRGIGRWSAEWFLARTLGRPRVVAGDLGVRKAVGRLYETVGIPSEDEVRRMTEHWGASATVVQTLALYDLAETDRVEGTD